VLTWARFSQSSVRFLNDLFYANDFTMMSVIVLWAALLAIGVFRRRDPRWLFAWVWVMVTPLPLAFLPDRGGAQLYIVLPGWSLAVAPGCRAVVRFLARNLRVLRVPLRAGLAAGLILCAGAYAGQTWKVDLINRFGFQKNGEGTLEIIDKLRALQIHPRPGSRIVFLNDPVPGFFDMQFIASLLWNDHSLHIQLQQFVHFKPEDLQNMDYVLDYKDGRFLVLKSP
jgi:hypothetical protein